MKRIIAAAVIAIAATSAKAEMVASMILPVFNGSAFLLYELSDIRAPAERCNGYTAGRGFRVSITSGQMFPQAIPYADGCWYTNRAKDVVVIGRLFQTGQEFFSSFPSDDFEKVPHFWQVAIGAR